MPDKTCGSCRFFHRHDESSEYGKCKRYPPEYPNTSHDEICGEYEEPDND